MITETAQNQPYLNAGRHSFLKFYKLKNTRFPIRAHISKQLSTAFICLFF